MVNDKYVVKYLDPRTGKYEYATIKDVGDLQKLNTKVKTSIVDAINSISTDGIGGLRNDLDTIGKTIKSLEDGTLELGDFQSIDDVVSREIEDAINNLKDENSGLLKLTQEEIDKIVSDAESEYRDSIAASVRELETSKTDLESAREKMTAIGQMLENADIDYSNLTQIVDDINLYITDVIEKTDFDMVNGIVSDYKTAVTQSKDGWGVDASKNMLSYLTGRVKNNETSLDVQHGLIQAKVGKDEFQYMTVDNLPAGKENMLHNTSDLRDWDFSSAFIFKSADDYRFTSIVQSDSAGENITGTTDELEQGVTYAISSYVNVQNKNKEPDEEKYAPTDGLYTATVIIDGDTIELNNVVEDNSALDGWKRVSGTFIAKRTAKQDIKFYVTSFNRDTQVGYLSAPKLEKGSSATSWIPHIEDNVSTILSQNAVMRVLSDRITSSVEEVRETKGAFETATSTFDQMADGFALNTNKLSEVLDKYGEVTGVQTQQASQLEVLNDSITSKVWKQDINTTLDTINIDTSNRIVNSAFNIYSYDEQTGELQLDYWDSNTGFEIKKHSQSLDNYLYAKRSNATSVNPISIKSSPFALRDGEKILFNFEYLAVGNPLDNDNVITLEMYDNNDVRVGLQEFKLSELKKEFLTAYDVGDSYKYNGTYIVKNSSVVKGTITLKLPKNGELWLTKIMLQNAGIGTIGWTPSSIDNQIIQSKLSTEINQLADSIELVAKDERLDAISGLLVKKDGKITISPEAIVSRVTSQTLGDNALITQTSIKQTEESLRFDLVDKDGIIQTINASADGLLIDFDKVQIDGEVIARMISAQSIDATQGFRLTDNNGNTLLSVVNDNGKPTLSITKDFRIKFGEISDKLDVTIIGIVEEYYYSVDPDEPIGGRWTSTPNAFQGGDNRFIWKRTKIIYQSGDTSYYPNETGVNITGSWEYEKESVTAEVVRALDSAENAQALAVSEAGSALAQAKADATAKANAIKEQITGEVNTAISTAEDAKALAVSESSRALTNANKYADEQDALIKQQVTNSVDTAISKAEDAKQTAETSYSNAVAKAEELAGEQSKAFNKKFEENTTAMSTLSQATKDAEAKAQSALSKAGVNANLLSTHQNTLNTIKNTTIPNVNKVAKDAMAEAKSALSSASSAMDEARKADGKVETFKTEIGNTVSDVNSKAQKAIDDANLVDGKVETFKTEVGNTISTVSDSAKSAMDEALKADGKISDYVTRNGLVSGTTVDSKINTATGEINQNISKVEGKIDGLQVGGRNLFAISKVPVHSRLEKSENKLTFINIYANGLGIKLGNILEVGKEYTISFKVRLLSGDVSVPGVSGSIRFYDPSRESPARQFGGNGEENISETFVLDSISESYSILFYGSHTGIYELKDIKIEKGNIATDWTPAPEDNYTQEEFKIFEASYNSSVEGITSRLSSAENSITTNNQAFTTFKENDYKRTAERVSDTFTKSETTTMLGAKADSSQLSNYLAKSTYERDAEQSKERFETIETNKADTTYVDSEVTNSANEIKTTLNSYAKTTDLNGLATETYATNKAVSEAGKVKSELTKYELKTGVDSKISTASSALRTETAEKLKTVYTKSETETLLGKKADSSTLKNYVQQATYESGIDGVSQSLTRVEGKIDGLQVGGRNYLLDSQYLETVGRVANHTFRVGDNGYIEVNSTATGGYISNLGFNKSKDLFNSNVEVGETYTVSFAVRSLDGASSTIDYYDKNAFVYHRMEGEMSDKFSRFHITGVKVNSNFDIHMRFNGVGKFEIKEAKLEIGTIATDWTPAPEDTLTQDEYKTFKSDYESTVEGITGQITSLSTSKLDGNTYTNFLSNDYKTTAERATSAFTKVNKVIDANGNSTDAFAKAVYDRNATRQSLAFQGVTKDLVTTATYTAGINGINQSITTVQGNLDNLSVGGRNLLLHGNGADISDYLTIYHIGGSREILSDSVVPSGNFLRINGYTTTGGAPSLYILGNSSRLSRDLIGKQATLSMYLRGDVPFSFYNQNVGTTWTRVHLTFTFGTFNAHFYIRDEGQNIVDISSIQIEEGNIATDWSPAPEDMLGKAEFTSFTNDYEETAESVERRLTAIDSSEEGSVVTRLNKTESTASGNKTTISNIKTKPGEQITGYQTIKERSDLYERVIGKDENGVKGNISRIVATSDIIQTEVAKFNGDGTNIVRIDSFSKLVADTFELKPNNYGFYVSGRTASTSARYYFNKDEGMIEGDWYTLGFEVESGSGNPISIEFNDVRIAYISKNQWGSSRIYANFKFSSRSSDPYAFIDFDLQSGAGFDIKNVAIKHGKAKTPFSIPVSEGIKDRSTITQLADNINLKVSKGDISNQININTQGVVIGGNKIALSGQTSVDGDFWAKQVNAIKVKADKIEGTTAQFNSLRSNILTANVITSTMINANTAMFDKLFSTTSATTRLSAQDAWIKSANIVSLDASKITAGTIATARLNSSAIVTAGLSANVVKSTHIESSTGLIDKIFANDALITRLTSNTIFASKIKAITIDASKITSGTIATARLDAGAIVTGGLSANVVKSTHIESSNGLIDKIFANDAYITRLTGKTAFINSIKALEINANKITSGTLDANKVTVSNLSASRIISGTLDASKVTVKNLDAANITTGNLKSINIVNTISYPEGGRTYKGDMAIAGGQISSYVTAGTGYFKSILLTDRVIRLSNQNATVHMEAGAITFDGTRTGGGQIWYQDNLARLVAGSYNGFALSAYRNGSYSDRLSVGGWNGEAVTPFVDIHTRLNMNYNKIENIHALFMKNAAGKTGATMFASSDNNLFLGGTWGTVIGHLGSDGKTIYEFLKADQASDSVRFSKKINMQGNTISNQSDERLKHNIYDLERDDLSILKDIRYKNFTFNNQDKETFGFIAQDLQNIMPSMITEETDGYLSYDSMEYTHFIGHALQQHVTKTDDEITKLKSQVASLQDELAQLKGA